MWPDTWFGRDIGHCCQQHDLAYLIGTPVKSAADIALAHCVYDATGSGLLGAVMLGGVTLFGWFFWRRRA